MLVRASLCVCWELVCSLVGRESPVVCSWAFELDDDDELGFAAAHFHRLWSFPFSFGLLPVVVFYVFASGFVLVGLASYWCFLLWAAFLTSSVESGIQAQGSVGSYSHVV